MSTFSLIFIAVLGVALLLFLVIVARLQAFIALLISSLFVAVIGGIPPGDIANVIREGMGNTLGYIAIIIGLGAMFGELLQASGGAETISNTLVKRFGDERAPWALGFTGLIIAIPVFFDVALILLIPLIYSLARRSGRSLLFYGIPLTAGIAVAHSFIPPTPGPVAVAGLLGADLGWVILFGLIAGVPAMIVGGIFFGRYIADKIHLEVPLGATNASSEAVQQEEAAEIAESRVHTAKEPLSFGLVLAIIAVPLVLILFNTVSAVLLPEDNPLLGWIAFIGHPFVALTIAALMSFYFLGIRQGFTQREVLQFATKSLEPVGLIILVTGAGGVFGRVLVETGIGEALADLMAASNLPIIVLAFLIATMVRVSQGSATVSMVTAAGLIAPAVELGNYSPPLVGAITISIASGATVLSHVNDSGFWLVGRFFDMTEAQTLRSWTVLETILGVVGFLVVLVASFFL
ncbi:gluconate:H+ symporter [Pseudanabaena sp. FACHB-2040]|uniref:GntP family permease n=1 Tax=Pseudanabaena sp. FACHB-2040 TaxID=2692859 RepID=UPI0016870005|nr:gluconate:H+ symporter [Pseudanabaena sp. FACHB-2040]MBD2256269.1 gluconate transporter [Pseudanabaena sp. FACHB-2040]